MSPEEDAGRPGGPLVLVGCGKMGGALLDGWLGRGLPPEEVWIVEPSDDARAAAARRDVHLLPDARGLPPDLAPRVVLFAVKPQVVVNALPAYGPLVDRGALVVSIAAGTAARRFTEAFGPETPVVRVMPNTPAAIGRGASVLWANAAVDDRGRALAAALMAAVGRVFWIEDEERMHAVTALSGSGPAYVFLLIEAMAEAGADAGLPPDLALDLARATVEGAGALASGTETPPSVLRSNVTSPGGTTEAALRVLTRDDGLSALLSRAVSAAAARSKELA